MDTALVELFVDSFWQILLTGLTVTIRLPKTVKSSIRTVPGI